MQKMKKVLALLLTLSMVLSYVPVPALAEEAVCPHHEHDETCGYQEAGTCSYSCELCGQVESACTGQSDCPADAHEDSCAKKLAEEQAAAEEAAKLAAEQAAAEEAAKLAAEQAAAEEAAKLAAEQAAAEEAAKASADQAAADAVAALINALLSLEEIQAKPVEEQAADYNQVNAAYDAYSKLTEEQRALLPAAENVFDPYFAYFSSLTEEAATYSGTCGTSATWQFNTTTGQLVIGGSGAMADYGHSRPWEEYVSDIISIKVGSSITYIGSNAFRFCSNVTSVSLPSGLREIGQGAFLKCSALTSVTLPKNVKLHSYVFQDCTGLSEIVIPSGVTYAYENSSAFYGCTGLTKAVFESGATTVPAWIFGECTVLKEVELPDSITTIGEGAFCACSALESITFPENVAAIAGWALMDCGSLGEIIFSGNAPEIAYDAFRGITANGYYPPNDATWTSDKLVDYGGDINWGVFSSEHVHDYDADHKCACGAIGGSCGDNATWTFDETTGTLTISGSGDMEGYNNSDADTPWGDFADSIISIVVEEGINSVGSYVFHDCTVLNSVVLPDSLTAIEWGAFSGCSNLSSIELPENLTSIDGSVFHSCYALASISIPASVTFIDPDAFMACNNLTGIWVAEENANYTSDSYGVLFNKDMTRLVKYPEGLIGSYVIPNGVITIGMDAFLGSQNLTGVTIPDTVSEISSYAFHGRNLLKKVIIPSSVTKIDVMAFGYCESLESITFESAAPSLSDWVFVETTATAYYPANDPTWTESVMQNYGGNITWKAYCKADHQFGDWVINGSSRERVCIFCGHTETEPLSLSKPVVKAVSNANTGGGTLTWNPVEGAEFYEVYRATSSGGKYSVISLTETTEAKVSVPVGKTYYFKVKAISEADSSLSSPFSSVVKVTGKCARPAVTVTASASSGKPVVKWGKITGAAKYEVYRATSASGTYSKVKTTTSTSYTDTAAKVGSTYCYKVKAIASTSTYNSAYSEAKSCLTVCGQPAVTLKASASSGKPVLTWTAITGARSYEIWRAETADGEFSLLAENLTALSYTDASAQPDKDYWYKVNAIGAREELNSADGKVQKIHATLAKPSVTFKVDNASGKPTLSWKAVEGAVEYKVYRSTSATTSYKAVKTITAGEDASYSYKDTSVAAGKGYYYKVIALGAAAKSAYSSYKKLTAKCAQPVITVTASSTSGKPYIKWSKISGAAKYEVYRATSESGTYSKIKTTTSAYYTDTAAKVGSTYYYKVKAVASTTTYNSVYSVAQSCTAKCAKPTVTAKTAASTGKPTLSWTAVSGAVSYEIQRSVDGGAYEFVTQQTGTTYTEKNAVVDSKYSYKVKAVGDNAELNSAEAVTTTVTAACAKPKVSIKLKSNKPSVSWSALDGAVKYAVYRSTSASGTYSKIKTVTGTGYTDTAARKGTTYYYKVKAVSNSTSGAYSSYVKITSK